MVRLARAIAPFALAISLPSFVEAQSVREGNAKDILDDNYGTDPNAKKALVWDKQPTQYDAYGKPLPKYDVNGSNIIFIKLI